MKHISSSLTYLRCCGLFFHFLTEIPAPEELQSSVWVPESEFYCLLRYLGLSVNQLRPTFSDPSLLELVNRYVCVFIYNIISGSITYDIYHNAELENMEEEIMVNMFVNGMSTSSDGVVMIVLVLWLVHLVVKVVSGNGNVSTNWSAYLMITLS